METPLETLTQLEGTLGGHTRAAYTSWIMEWRLVKLLQAGKLLTGTGVCGFTTVIFSSHPTCKGSLPTRPWQAIELCWTLAEPRAHIRQAATARLGLAHY